MVRPAKAGVVSPLSGIKSRIGNRALLAERREQLVEAITELFERKGFHNTTMEEIAEKLDVTVGALYRYVGRKEDLLVLLLDDIFNVELEAIRAALGSEPDPVNKLRAAVSSFYRLIADNRQKVLIAYRESRVLSGSELVWLKQRELERVMEFANVIRSGIKQRVFRRLDVDVVAFDIVMLGHAWALKRWFFQDRISIGEFIDVQLGVILRGLKPEDSSNA